MAETEQTTTEETTDETTETTADEAVVLTLGENTMANDAKNVSVGKPKTDGALYWAPSGTDLPTDATTALAAKFKALGYASEDGVSVSEGRDSEDIKAWGGTTVLKPQTGYDATLTVTFIETLNSQVAKVVYGESNVTVTDTTFSIKHTADTADEGVLVVDMLMTGGKAKRLVIPRAQMSEQDDTSYTDGDVIGWACTFACLPDDSGVAIYEY